MQNAEALAKDALIAVMGQVQATHYRQYVHARLINASDKETCANPTCQPRKGDQKWVECENCFAWWHFKCAKLRKKTKRFLLSNMHQKVVKSGMLNVSYSVKKHSTYLVKLSYLVYLKLF